VISLSPHSEHKVRKIKSEGLEGEGRVNGKAWQACWLTDRKERKLYLFSDQDNKIHRMVALFQDINGSKLQNECKCTIKPS